MFRRGKQWSTKTVKDVLRSVGVNGNWKKRTGMDADTEPKKKRRTD